MIKSKKYHMVLEGQKDYVLSTLVLWSMYAVSTY